MPTVIVKRTINAPREALWAAFADHGNVADFHPGIESSKAINDVQGVGGARVCEFGKGQGVTEEITAWRDGEVLTFAATEFRKLPMKRMVATFDFAGSEPTTVTFTMDYKMKGGPLMDLMAKRMMRKAGEGMLDGVRTKL